MATKPKTQVGIMECLCCGETIPVKATENGTLSHPCPWCEYPGYAKAGTPAHGIVKAKVKFKEQPPATPQAPATAPATKPKTPAPTQGPKQTPTPTPAQKPKGPASIFHF